MKKTMFALCGALFWISTALAADQIFHQQIQMLPPPTDGKHVVTKEYADSADASAAQAAAEALAAETLNRTEADDAEADSRRLADENEALSRANADAALGARIDGVKATADNSVQYDADGNITFEAGMDMNVSIPQPNDPSTGDPVPPVKRTVLDTDNNGNFIVGNTDGELNLRASERPTTQIGSEATARRNAFLEDIEGTYATEAYVDAADALKADLVGGSVPESQMPPGAIPHNWTVPTAADVVTLTSAIPNDRAFPDDEPNTVYILIANDPTVLENWRSAGGGGGDGGTAGVTSWAGKVGVVTPEIEDIAGLEERLLDTPTSEDISALAPLASPAFTGTPTAPTPPASAVGKEVMTAEAVNTKLTSNLGNTLPLADGTASAGTSAQVARADHVHPASGGSGGGGELTENSIFAAANFQSYNTGSTLQVFSKTSRIASIVNSGRTGVMINLTEPLPKNAILLITPYEGNLSATTNVQITSQQGITAGSMYVAFTFIPQISRLYFSLLVVLVD